MLYGAGWVTTLPTERAGWGFAPKVRTLPGPTPDQITNPSDYLAIFAMYRKVPTYTGPIWKVRRSYDNVELDCYTKAEVSTHLGGSTGYVITWYDQSGNGKHAYEASSASCPIFNLVDADLKDSLPSLDHSPGGMQFTGGLAPFSSNFIISVGYKPRSAPASSHRVLTADQPWLVGPYQSNHQLYSNGFAPGFPAYAGTEVIVSTYRQSGGLPKLRVNGRYNGEAGTLTATQMYLGKYGNNGHELSNSNIFELLVRNLNATVCTERAVIDVETKMNFKYQAFPTEYAAWVAAVAAAGGTKDATSDSRALALSTDLAAKSYSGKILYLLPFLGTNLAAARVPLRDGRTGSPVGQAASYNHVEGDFSQVTGLVSDGSSKRLDTLMTVNNLGPSRNGGMGYWSNATANGWVFGSHYGPGQMFGMSLSATDEVSAWGDGNSYFWSGVASGNRHYYLQRSDANTRELFKNGSFALADGVSPAPNDTQSGYAINVGGISSGNCGSGRCACFYLTDGSLTRDEIADFHTFLNSTLITPLGR